MFRCRNDVFLVIRFVLGFRLIDPETGCNLLPELSLLKFKPGMERCCFQSHFL